MVTPLVPTADDARAGWLATIAQKARGTYQTVEGMAQAFIRDGIVRGVFVPGERLNQDEIAEALGISRMPIRAGLRQLEGEGLVVISPHRGASVSVLRPAEIAEIYEMRKLLETYLLSRAMQRLTAEDLVHLVSIAHRIDDVSTRAAHVQNREQFYRFLYSFADRPRMLAATEQLRVSVGRYLVLIKIREPSGRHELIDHLHSRDEAAAVEWLTEHLNWVSEHLRAAVTENGLVNEPSPPTEFQ